MNDYQRDCIKWYGKALQDICPIEDRYERLNRLAEEANELLQAAGMSREQAHNAVDAVYDRPVGEFRQEVAGTMLTLSLLCSSYHVDLMDAAEDELDAAYHKIEKIRARARNEYKGLKP